MVRSRETTRERARKIAHDSLRHENAILILILLVLIGIMGGVTQGASLARQNMLNVLVQSAQRGIAAVGQTFVVLSAGIDISVGGIALFTSIIAGGLMTSDPVFQIAGHALPMYLSFFLMLLLAIGLGGINGSLVSRAGIPALIVTLGMWEIMKGAAFQACSGGTIGYLPESLTFFGSGKIAGLGVPVIIFIAVAVVAYFVLHYTTFGRSVYAVGGNPLSAWLSGVNVKKIQFTVYVISGFLAGLAGLIWVARLFSVSMRTASGLELDSIAAVFIGGISLMGGRGTVIGAVIGTLIIGVINNAMSILGAGPPIQGIVKGTIIIAAVGIDYARRRG
jgi:putative xylitol transport system permease protein